MKPSSREEMRIAVCRILLNQAGRPESDEAPAEHSTWKDGESGIGVTGGTGIVNDLGLDSLDVVEAEMEFEDAFDIQIGETDLQGKHTVGEVVDFLWAKVSGTAA